MRPILFLLCLVASAMPASGQQMAGGPRSTAVPPATATVWGQVRSERSGIPIRHAIVELLAPNQAPVSAVTDSLGIYILTSVPTGRRLLRATHIDHAPNEAEMVIEGGGRHQLDFDLELRPLRLTPVTARSARAAIGVEAALDTVTVSQADVGAVAMRVLESTPGVAELGLAEAAAEVPGREPVDPTDVLYVRGGAADLKLVLLNGAPVYAPFHVGGLINALDADIMRSAALHTGGAQSRYDGGLSYVMDLETRSARASRPHARIAADLLAARALVEGPVLGSTTALLSGRIVHGEGTRAWIGDPFPYAYADGLARLDVPLGAEHLVTVTGFWNREQITLDTLGSERQYATWGNRAGSARLRGRAIDHDMLLTVAVGQFRTTLPLGGVRPLMSEGTANRTRVGIDFERQAGPVRVTWGGSFDRLIFEYRAFPQGASRDSAIVDRSQARGLASGMYAEAAYSPFPRLRLRAGMRADVFSTDPALRLAPRVAATLLLTDRVSLSLGGGRYRQYVRAPERSRVFLGDVADTLTIAEATHLVLGLTQELGEGIRLGLEGHFKQFEGLHFAKAKRTESSGVDLWVRRNTGAVTGWLGYSLAWIWTVESEQPRPTQSFAGRHLVSAGVAGPVVGQGAFDVRVSYGAGLPYTAIPEPESAAPVFGMGFKMLNTQSTANPDVGALPVEPQQPYVRVDAQVQRTWTGQWRDFDFEVTPYFKVINALNRRDAIFYHYNRDLGAAEPLGGLPVVPIVGLEWRF